MWRERRRRTFAFPVVLALDAVDGEGVVPCVLISNLLTRVKKDEDFFYVGF